MFWVLVLLYYEVLPNQLLLLSHLQWTAVTQSRWKPCSRTHCSTVMLIMSCSKPSPYSFLLIILVQVYLNSSRPKNAFPEVAWLVRCLSLIWLVWSLWWSLCFALVMSSLDFRHALSLMDLFCFWSLTIVCFSCMERSFDRMMWFTETASEYKWHTLESTPDLSPA